MRNGDWQNIPEPGSPAFRPLTVRKPSEILAMEFSDEDFLLAGGYLSKGDPIAICGAPGVGKSRLSMQLMIALSWDGRQTGKEPAG